MKIAIRRLHKHPRLVIERGVAKNDPKKPVGIPLPGAGTITGFKLGPGVVGRTSHVMAAFLALLLAGVVALRGDTSAVFVLIVIGAAMTIVYLIVSFWFANKYPNHAIMDGAEFVRHAELEFAASDPKIIDLKADPVANTQAPKAIRGPGGDHV